LRRNLPNAGTESHPHRRPLPTSSVPYSLRQPAPTDAAKCSAQALHQPGNSALPLEEIPMKMKISPLVAIPFALVLIAPAFAGPAEDAMLTGKVKAALVASPDAKARQVDVESKDGVVQLKGFVDDATHITAATAVANGVEGVTKVENNLKVQPAANRSAGAVIDDAMITTKVKSSLLADSATSGLKIDVDTRQGKVQLNGFVASDTEKTVAQNIAARTEGVTSVENNLTVRR
jgi:hyperosmotically inducible protein